MGSIDITDAVVAIVVLIAFIAGVAGGVLLVVSLASRREDRRYTLTGEAPDPACRGARWLTGAGIRGDRFLSDGLRADQDGAEDTQGQELDR